MNTPAKQWSHTLYNLQLYKLVTLCLLTICFLLIAYMYFLSFKSTLVLDRRDQVFHNTTPLTIEESDVQNFIQRFIELRYNWNEFDPALILKRIQPVTTKDFRKYLSNQLGKRKAENTKGDSMEQYVSNIKPWLSETQAFASFDRIIRLNGMPLVSPAQLKFHILQGPKTTWNPLGLYIDQISIYEK